MKKFISITSIFFFTFCSVLSANPSKVDSIVTKIDSSLSMISIFKPGGELPELILTKNGRVVSANSLRNKDSLIYKVSHQLSVATVIKNGGKPELILIKNGQVMSAKQSDAPPFEIRIVLLIIFCIILYVGVLVYKLFNKKEYQKKEKQDI